MLQLRVHRMRNLIGKTVLWLMGLLLLGSRVYPHILEGYYLTDRPADEWDSTDTVLAFLSLALILGGIWLNKLLGAGINLISGLRK